MYIHTYIHSFIHTFIYTHIYTGQVEARGSIEEEVNVARDFGQFVCPRLNKGHLEGSSFVTAVDTFNLNLVT